MRRNAASVIDITEQELADLQGRLDPSSFYRVVSRDGDFIRLLDPSGQVVGGAGQLANDQWRSAPTISRLRIVGTGSVSIDSRDRAGNVSAGVFSGSYSATPETIEFPYYGDAAVEIRATFPATLAVEVI